MTEAKKIRVKVKRRKLKLKNIFLALLIVILFTLPLSCLAATKKQLEQEQLKQNVPSFRPGDTLEVKVWVVEGSKRRLQAFEGVVIAIRNRGLHSAFTLRKISNGVGVERVFQTHSPAVDSIAVKRKGAVRKAKLYYLRERSGKSARIKERLGE